MYIVLRWLFNDTEIHVHVEWTLNGFEWPFDAGIGYLGCLVSIF